MIRLVGIANYHFDLAPINSGEEWDPVLRYPDGTPCVDVPIDALAFWLVVHYDGESSCSPFVLLPECPEDWCRFDRLRTCYAQLDSGTGPPDASAIESIESWIEDQRAKLECKWRDLQSAKDAITVSPCFLAALKQVLSRPLSLVPARPKGCDCVLYSNRLWTTREILSGEDWRLLVLEYDERRNARLHALEKKHRMDDASEQRAQPGSRCPESSYQTAPLIEYRASFRDQAEDLYGAVRDSIGSRAKKYKGSYSIFGASTSETVANVIIYEGGLGRENGVVPLTVDGVYVLLRTSGEAGRLIWDSELLRALGYDRCFDREKTIGIAPNHRERFTYYHLADKEDLRSVARLLVKCSEV